MMKYIRLVLLFTILSLVGQTLFAQQEALFSRYLFNTMTITPAYAGSHEALRVSMQARRQWLGINGSPATGVLGVDGVSRDIRAGWGLLLGYEQIGLYTTQDIHGNYAYRMDMGDGKLALGIRAGGTLYQHRAQEAALTDPSDPLYIENASFFVPKMGVGAYYQDDTWFAGISVPNLATYRPGQPFTLNDDVSFIRRHYYLHTGWLAEIDRGLLIKPSLLLKYVKNAPLQADINLQLYVNNKIGIGGGYRTGDAVVLLMEFFPNEQLRIGYSYDATVSRLKKVGSNAHEIIFGYELQGKSNYRNINRYKMQDIKYF